MEQANNTALIIKNMIDRAPKSDNGYDGKNAEKDIEDLMKNSTESEIKKEGKNGGFIDISRFLQSKFENGIDKNIDEEKILYNICTALWKNMICLKLNLEKDVDYKENDTVLDYTGEKELKMEKRNMHAIAGKTIETDKIDVVVNNDGYPANAWNVLCEMAEKYKNDLGENVGLPVESWRIPKKIENGIIEFSDEIGYAKDYLSTFIEIEKKEKNNKKINTKKMAKTFVKDKDVAKENENSKKMLEELEKIEEKDIEKNVEEI